MKNTLGLTMKKTFGEICIIFFIITLLDSAIRVALLGADIGVITVIHLILGFGIITISVGMDYVVRKYMRAVGVKAYIIHYTATLGLVMGFYWLIGFIDSVNPSGYRDLFLYFTFMYIIVAIAYKIKYNRVLRRKSVA